MNRQISLSEAAGTAGLGVLSLDATGLWNDAMFRNKLLQALEVEKFDPEALDIVREFFATFATPDFQACEIAATTYIAQLPPTKARLLEGVLGHWQEVRAHNETVYGPRSIAEYKARFWPNNAKLKQTKWEYYEDLYEADLFVEPQRFITKDTAITSAGSCFAANISRQLQFWGYNYLVEMAQPPAHDHHIGNYPTDPAACGNIYNVLSMRQMVERAFGEWEPEKLLVSTHPVYSDPFRAIVDYDSIEGYLAKSEQHNAALGRALRKSEVFILTLGMTEAWVFADTGLAISAAPRRGDSTLYRHKDLNIEDNVRELERIGALFRKHNPNAKIITTVSPVPLNATFHTDRHVAVANGISKATLRVALETMSQKYPDQFIYFPSYEVVVTATLSPWEIDLRHVSNAAVTRVMQQFQRMFFIDQSPLEVLPMTPIDVLYSQSRNPILRYGREWLVHPMKRRLGIEGRPLSDLLWQRK